MAPGQTTGFVEGLPRRINLDRAVPGFSTFSRRQMTQKVNIAFRGSRGPLHLPIDGPGISSQNQAPEQAPGSGPGITAGAA